MRRCFLFTHITWAARKKKGGGERTRVRAESRDPKIGVRACQHGPIIEAHPPLRGPEYVIVRMHIMRTQHEAILTTLSTIWLLDQQKFSRIQNSTCRTVTPGQAKESESL